MDCRRASNLVALHADGALADGEAAALGRHVSACASCAARLAEAAVVREALVGLPRVAAPDDLWPAIRRRILAERQRRARARRRMRRLVPAFAPLVAAAALMVAVILAPGARAPVTPPEASRGPQDVAVLLNEHAQLANEAFVGGDDLLVAEYAFPAELIDE